MQKPVIFEYSAFDHYFRDMINWHREKNPIFSFAYLAKKIGVKSKQTLVMMASGKRPVNNDLLDKLGSYFQWNETESTFASLLGLAARATSTFEKRSFLRALDEIRPTQFAVKIAATDGGYFSNWLNIALMEMLRLPEFENRPVKVDALRQKIYTEVTSEDVAASLENLVSLGLIDKNEDGKITIKQGNIQSDDAQPAPGLRKWHRQMLRIATDALDDIPIDQRYFLNLALPMESEKYKEAVNIIIDFQMNFSRLFATDSPDSVHQLGVYLIPLTRPANSKPPLNSQ